MSKAKFNPASSAAEKFLSRVDDTPKGTEETGVTTGEQQGATKEAKGAKRQTRPTTKTGLIQKGYDLTEEQHKKLKMLAAENDTDMSSIIREALDQYFQSL